MSPSMIFEIVATLGPASDQLLEPLLNAGVSGFRLNTSHMSFERITLLAQRIRSLNSQLPIIFDLQGAKMRLGVFAPRPVLKGEEVIFAQDPFGDTSIPLEHAEIYEEVEVGQTVSVDDDRLRFEIVGKGTQQVLGRALSDGLLKPRKGINVTEHPVELRRLRDFDRQVCRLASELAETSCAISFVKDGREAAWVRELSAGSRVIAKIERAEAVANLDQICEEVDCVWVCRGDLGAQIGLDRMARWISSLNPAAWPRPMWMAGQVLEHLTAHGEPTRSEVCHLYDLVTRGYAGVVLSDETAIGANPVGAVQVTVSLARSFLS